MTPRHLPPGTLRRLRLKWFALGVFLGVLVCIVFAMWLAAIAPHEMAYRGVSSAPRALVADIRHASVQIPPCVGNGKDCEQINTVPEPGTLSLIGAGLAWILWRARTSRLVFDAIEGERTTGFDTQQLQAIGEHLVMSVLKEFDRQAREL